MKWSFWSSERLDQSSLSCERVDLLRLPVLALPELVELLGGHELLLGASVFVLASARVGLLRELLERCHAGSLLRRR